MHAPSARVHVQIFREKALLRRHFDSDPVPFDVYTADEEEWAAFSSAVCDPSVLELPPSRCDQEMQPERSVLTCDELRQGFRVPGVLEVRARWAPRTHFHDAAPMCARCMPEGPRASCRELML